MGRCELKILNAIALALAALPAAAAAQDVPPFDWRGFYAGVHAGAGLDLANVEDPFGASIFGDTARTTGLLGGAQAGYNWQLGAAVLGLEADASLADMVGTNTCFAYSGFYVSSYCKARIDALGTVTGRLGWALPGDGRTLLYGKGGLAWAHDSITAHPNRNSLTSSASAGGLLWGWVLGGGIERALNRHWSLKTEYDYLHFDQGFAAPESRFQTAVGPPETLVQVPETATEISHDVQQVKIGLNYRFGDGATPLDPAWEWGTAADGSAPPPAGTQIEAGVRYVRGWARLQRDQLQKDKPSITQSKLTYEGIPSDGTEGFARLDTPFDVMVKGIVGTGSGSSGAKNDEDWSLTVNNLSIPYSNTVSFPTYDIHYFTVDAGYDVWRTQATKIALFAGYSYFKQAFMTYGCKQIADPNSDCGGNSAVPTSVPGQSDTDKWRALRLGAVMDTWLAPGLKLIGDIAYLPYVKLTAINHHFLRHLVSPEWGDGAGVQLEAILSYALVDQLSVGVGARYWSMWADGATDRSGSIIPMHFAAEQAALLVQAPTSSALRRTTRRQAPAQPMAFLRADSRVSTAGS
jgi:opacity protein-like surface antigen